MTRSLHIQEELQELSNSVSSLPVVNPYSVPAAYFDNFAEVVLSRIKSINVVSASEEISAISPLLAGLNKKMPFDVPKDYFEKNIPSLPEVPARKARVISMSAQRVFRYAAAAITVGLIFVAAWFFNRESGISNNELAINKDSVAEQHVQANINTLSDTEIAAFVEEGSLIYSIEAPVITNELQREDDIQLMLAEVSDEELEKYLNQLNPNREILN